MEDSTEDLGVAIPNLSSSNRKTREEAVSQIHSFVESASKRVHSLARTKSVYVPIDPPALECDKDGLRFCQLFCTLFPHILPRINDAAEKIRYTSLQTLLSFFDTIDFSLADVQDQALVPLLVDFLSHRLGLPHTASPSPLFLSACSGDAALSASQPEGSEEVRGVIMDVLLRVCAGDVTPWYVSFWLQSYMKKMLIFIIYMEIYA